MGIIHGLLVLAVACAPDAGPPPGDHVTVTDSAGVRVVDLGDAPLDLVERRALAPEPDLVIRSSDDASSSVLFDVRDVEVLPQGHIAVANGSGNEILVFDATGERVAMWGGTGDGPGEFRDLEWLALLAPDTLAAGDRSLRRVTVFDARGRHVRSFGTAEAVDWMSTPIPPRPMGLLGDGSVVAAAFFPPDPVEGSVRPAVDVVAIPPTGDTVHAIGSWPGQELAVFRHDGILDVTQPPFGRRLYIVPVPDGVWIADDDQWEARKYSAKGELLMVVRSSASPGAVTDELLEALISQRYRDAVEGSALEGLKQDQREITRHTATPSFGMILGTTDGGVAVREFGVGTAPPRTWITVRPGGTAAALEVPAGFAVMRWGPDWVVGVVRDSLDREEIHRYRILAGATPDS